MNFELAGMALTLLIALATMMFAGGRMLVSQFDRRLNERFEALDASRENSQNHWDAKFAALERATSADAEEWRRIEREFMKFQAALPLEYQRREDAIRDQSRIESKLDGLAKLFQRSKNNGD
ncbi:MULTISPECIES: hypothetical protein [Methylobacter]